MQLTLTPYASARTLSPNVIPLKDGRYQMYYSGWSETIQGGVFTTTSEDGLNWQREVEPIIDLDEGEPRLFYECSDDDEIIESSRLQAPEERGFGYQSL